MKKILITGAFLVLCISQLVAQDRVITKRSTSTSHTDEGESNIITDDDNGSLMIKWKGEIKLTEDERGFASLSPGAYVKYSKNGRKILVKTNEAGLLSYQFNGKENKTALTESDKNLLAEIVKELIAHGVGAKDRALRIYNKQGLTGLVNEIQLLKTDYVKGIYFETLLAGKSFSQQDIKLVLPKIGTLIESDYEKGKLLKAVAIDHLSDAQTTEAYFNAVKSIESDYEKANAIKAFVRNQLTEEQFTQSLDATKTIGSDYEKANVLKQILAQSPSGSRFEQALSIVNSIESDFEKAGVLKKLIGKGTFAGNNFDQLLSAIGSIDSDFEKANVYKTVLEKEIDSDDHWIGLLKGIEKIESDFEKASVLVTASKKLPVGEKVTAAYRAAAKTIDSDFEYGRVMKAIR